jgi:FHA domain
LKGAVPFENDMTTYFGSYNLTDIDPKDDLEPEKLNDVLLPKSEGFGRRHFMIQFSIEKNGYYLRDLNDGSGTFIKIDTEKILKNGQIVSFGETHMVVGILQEDADQPKDSVRSQVQPLQEQNDQTFYKETEKAPLH